MNMEVIINIWRVICKRLGLIIMIPLLCVTATGLVSFYLLVPTYESSTTLLVQPQNMTNQNMYNSVLVNQQLIKTYGGLLKSKKIAMDVIRKLELKQTPEQLLSNLDVKTSNVSFIITITYTDIDPAVAVRIVNEVSRSFAQNVNLFVNVDNVMIVDEAELNKNAAPVNPKPYMNMAIALGMGLLVSISLAFFFETISSVMKKSKRKAYEAGQI